MPASPLVSATSQGLVSAFFWTSARAPLISVFGVWCMDKFQEAAVQILSTLGTVAYKLYWLSNDKNCQFRNFQRGT